VRRGLVILVKEAKDEIQNGKPSTPMSIQEPPLKWMTMDFEQVDCMRRWALWQECKGLAVRVRSRGGPKL
jgi:hypothetical protein